MSSSTCSASPIVWPFIVPEGDVASVRYKTPSGEWRSLYTGLQQTGDPKEMDNLRRVFDATDDDLEALGKFYMAILSVQDEDLDALDDVGMLDWMRPFGLSKALESQTCMNLNTLFCVPANRVPASEAIFTMRQQVLGGAGRYHKGGFGRVAEACVEYVIEHGGTYLPKTRVKRIVVEDGRAVGIETEKGEEVRARAVISNAGIQPTVLKLAGRECFPDDYVARVESLEPSWSVAGYRYVLDAEVFDAALIPIFSDQSWMDDERFEKIEAGDWPDVPLINIDVDSGFNVAAMVNDDLG